VPSTSSLPISVPTATVDTATSRPGVPPKVAPSWLEAETYDYVLRAHEEMIVKVRMRIPKGFSRSSARACLLVTSKPEKAADKKGPRLNIELRYAVNVLYRNPVVPPVVAMEAKALAGRGGQQGLGIALSECWKRRPHHFLSSTFTERPRRSRCIKPKVYTRKD
jgi:hypothetical protein